ncbi:MAG TPA: glycosyltransferase [Bryobacteraceae bacterium]|nr:glycosyltransferase [Bryobacteraceae bacterium]
MNILLMIHSLGHGGSERQLANTALGLDRSRFKPYVASVLEGFQADALRRAGIPVFHVPLTSFVRPSVVSVARLVRSYIQDNRIQLVHTFDHTLSLLGVPVARTCPGVTVLSSQRFYMDLVPRKFRGPLVMTHRMAHGIVANCEEMKRHLRESYAYPAERIQVCYNGIDTSRFHFFPDRIRLPGMEDASLIVGTVCVLRPEKNLGHLLEAFARVRQLRPGMKLLIVGSGPEREGLVARAAVLGIADACVFQPSTADVPTAMRAIDIFVHPSLTEGLPNGVMEAMACGCTVVASRVGGCPELIDEGRTGFLFRAGDLDDLTRSLTAAIMADEARGCIAAAAAERMKGFSIARAAARMQEIYDSFLG